jgi:hypothetical protein
VHPWNTAAHTAQTSAEQRKYYDGELILITPEIVLFHILPFHVGMPDPYQIAVADVRVTCGAIWPHRF